MMLSAAGTDPREDGLKPPVPPWVMKRVWLPRRMRFANSTRMPKIKSGEPTAAASPYWGGICCVWKYMSVVSTVTPSFAPSSCRSEEHTSELQSRRDLVCRLLLEKKKQT